MSFGVAALIALGAVAVFLGLLAYHLAGRLDSIEQALYGGLRPPSHTLRREEFGRRFAAAKHRAEFARRFDTVVVVICEPASPTTSALLATLQAMPQRRHWVLGFVADSGETADGDVSVPDGVATIDLRRHDLTEMAIAALPFCLVIDGGVVLDARPVGSPDAIEAMLLEVA